MIQTIAPDEANIQLFIRMSSAGKCRRQIGYEVLGYPESDPTPTEGRNVMNLGDAVEMLLIRRLREEGWEVDLTRWACPEPGRRDGGQQLEVRLDNPPRLGHPDGRCRHPELTRNLWVLLECKGMNAHKYRRFLSEGFLRSHTQYLGQVTQYGVALHKGGLVASPNAAVVAAMDRDTGRWGYQRVRWDMGVYEDRSVELSQAWTAILIGELPDRDHDGTTWHCSPRYCRWSSLCWQNNRPVRQDAEASEGSLDASALAEAGELVSAAEMWREGKEMENGGKALQDEARNVFHDLLTSYGAKRLAVDGLTVNNVTSHRRSWDEKELRRILTEEQMLQVQRVSESTSLRVSDTEADRSAE